jgi:hypothetical protein
VGETTYGHLKKLSGARVKAKSCLKKNYGRWPFRSKE